MKEPEDPFRAILFLGYSSVLSYICLGSLILNLFATGSSLAHIRSHFFVKKSPYLCTPHRGVEQSVARRAHNPEVVGSSPASTAETKPLSPPPLRGCPQGHGGKDSPAGFRPPPSVGLRPPSQGWHLSFSNHLITKQLEKHWFQT